MTEDNVGHLFIPITTDGTNDDDNDGTSDICICDQMKLVSLLLSID